MSEIRILQNPKNSPNIQHPKTEEKNANMLKFAAEYFLRQNY